MDCIIRESNSIYQIEPGKEVIITQQIDYDRGNSITAKDIFNNCYNNYTSEVVVGAWSKTVLCSSFDLKRLFIDKHYQNAQSSEIDEYLKNNDYLYDLLMEAYFAVKEIFGKETTLVMQFINDIENVKIKQLFVLIESDETSAQKFEKLDKFDQAWFLPNYVRTKGKFNFDIYT